MYASMKNKKSTGVSRCSVSRQLASVEFFVECFYSTSSSVNALFATVEWMAYVADFYFDIFFGSRSGFEFVTASADNFYSFVLWVNTFFHPLHLFLLKFRNYTLHLISILISGQLVNHFFTDFYIFCESAARKSILRFPTFSGTVLCSCQWPHPAVLPPEYSERPEHPAVLLLTVQ